MSDSQNIPLGLCQCGCGQRTNIAHASNARLGWVKGQRFRYVKGHSGRRAASLALFLSNIGPSDENGCWPWRGVVAANGYGRVSTGYSTIPAHRYSYEHYVGPVEPGLVLDHLCRNRACVNPAHLEPVTHPENCRRGAGTKLTKDDVESIRKAYSQGTTQSQLAEKHDVAQSTISRIVTGIRWGAQ